MSAAARMLLQELVQILGDEGTALAGDDMAQLDRLVQRKQQVLHQLAPMLRALDADQRPLRQLREAARLNAANSALLAPRLRSTRAGLEVLGIEAGAGVYAHDGGVANSAAPQTVRASA